MGFGGQNKIRCQTGNWTKKSRVHKTNLLANIKLAVGSIFLKRGIKVNIIEQQVVIKMVRIIAIQVCLAGALKYSHVLDVV